MNLDIKNKYALVTGGSHGIGRAIALALADEGCNVAVCALSQEEVNEAVGKIKDKGVKAVGVVADVMQIENIEKVMKTVIDEFGTIDILINNVGGGGRWGKEDVVATPEDVWLDVYNKNALAAVRFTMKSLPFMQKQKWGRVITISSIYGKEGGGRPWFTMAKSAEISLMKSLAMDKNLTRDGITFNSVAPGPIMIPDTGWSKEEKEHPEVFKKFAENLPLGRLGTPEEVASVVVFLASKEASLVNGACIAIDGGESRSF